MLAQECPGVSAEMLGNLYERMAQNESNNDPTSLRYAHLHYLLGYVYAATSEPAKAVRSFRSSLDARPDPSAAMDMAARLASNNHHQAALTISDLAMQLLEMGARPGSSVTEEGIQVFQEIVRADLAADQGGDTADPAQ
jgi:uncharacterized protein HemY